MSFAAAGLLGLALSITHSHAVAPAPRAVRAADAPCTRYRVIAEKNELVGEDDAAGWAAGALRAAGLLDERSPCWLHVRITAGPTRTGGKTDGWVAHVALSTRRYVTEGKLVTSERGKLFIDPDRDSVVRTARSFVEEFVSGLKAQPPEARSGPPAPPPPRP